MDIDALAMELFKYEKSNKSGRKPGYHDADWAGLTTDYPKNAEYFRAMASRVLEVLGLNSNDHVAPEGYDLVPSGSWIPRKRVRVGRAMRYERVERPITRKVPRLRRR